MDAHHSLNSYRVRTGPLPRGSSTVWVVPSLKLLPPKKDWLALKAGIQQCKEPQQISLPVTKMSST
jgi:hypothetical protein